MVENVDQQIRNDEVKDDREWDERGHALAEFLRERGIDEHLQSAVPYDPGRYRRSHDAVSVRLLAHILKRLIIIEEKLATE